LEGEGGKGMGCHKKIGFDKFPRQGDFAGRRVEVVFLYDTSRKIYGTIVRDDREDPYRTIIKLDDGRYIEACECQFRLLA
jgi:hypothetical protein